MLCTIDWAATWATLSRIATGIVQLATLGVAIYAACWAKRAAIYTGKAAKSAQVALKHAAAANVISREAMTAENRAWIEIEIVLPHGDLVCADDTFQFEVQTRLRNVGRSVALNVVTQVELVREPNHQQHQIGDVSPELAAIYERISEQPPSIMSEIIFPGRETEPRPWAPKVHADSAESIAGGQGTDVYPLSLVIGIRYNTIFDRRGDKGHQTILICNLRRRPTEAQPQFHPLIIGRATVPAAELRLIHPAENFGIVT